MRELPKEEILAAGVFCIEWLMSTFRCSPILYIDVRAHFLRNPLWRFRFVSTFRPPDRSMWRVAFGTVDDGGILVVSLVHMYGLTDRLDRQHVR